MSPKDASAAKKAGENPAAPEDYETEVPAEPDAEAGRDCARVADETETGQKVRMAP
jgi:hypothetical protein